MTEPRWSAGLPLNLEAAAADALEWLRLIRDTDLLKRATLPQPLLDETRARLGGAIRSLEAALARRVRGGSGA